MEAKSTFRTKKGKRVDKSMGYMFLLNICKTARTNINNEITENNYWNDEYVGFGFEQDKNNKDHLNLIYELALGGPNAFLIYTYNRKEIAPYPCTWNGLLNTYYQYHWWGISCAFDIDITNNRSLTDPDDNVIHESIQECLEAIFDEACDTAYHNNLLEE